jgi:hypothetical protein
MNRSRKKLGHLKVKDFCPFSSITKKYLLGMDFFHRTRIYTLQRNAQKGFVGAGDFG